MFNKYSYLNKLMLTFTYSDNDKYFKMKVINEIKNYVTKLISNTKSDNIKFFSNIELGDEFDNPHLHVQLFYDDYNQIMKIRDKVISKFGLFSEYCEVSIPECCGAVYSYVVKDYSKDVSDGRLLLLDTIKRDYRHMLGSKIRFTSMSKEKYTKSTYKKAYCNGIRKEYVDDLIDNSIINKEIQIVDKELIYYIFTTFIIRYRIKHIAIKLCALLYFLNKDYSHNLKLWRVFIYF